MADCNINGKTMGMLRITISIYSVHVCAYVCMYVSVCTFVCKRAGTEGGGGGGAESRHDLCYILHNVTLSTKSTMLCLLICLCVVVVYCVYVCVCAETCNL